MRKYFFEEDRLYLAADSEWIGSPEEDLKLHLRSAIPHFLRRPLFRRLVEAYGRACQKRGCAVIEGHAGSRKGKWTFSDGKKPIILQNLVDSLDGDVLAIMLYCCNPSTKKHELRSDKSIVIHTNRPVNVVDMHHHGIMRLFLPGEGYLEDRVDLHQAIEKYSKA